MNIKLQDEVSFIDSDAGTPSLKRGRVIQIVVTTIEKFDIRTEEESSEIRSQAIVQESEIGQDNKGKDIVVYNRLRHSKNFDELFANDSDAKKYVRDLFA